MSLTTPIRASEANFKFAQKIVTSLSEAFNFSFEDGWNYLGSSNIDALKRKFKKESKKNNPYSAIKNVARTSFSFYTKDNRKRIQEENPNAPLENFLNWYPLNGINLLIKKRKFIKQREIKDKARYKKEREELAKKLKVRLPIKLLQKKLRFLLLHKNHLQREEQ